MFGTTDGPDSAGDDVRFLANRMDVFAGSFQNFVTKIKDEELNKHGNYLYKEAAHIMRQTYNLAHELEEKPISFKLEPIDHRYKRVEVYGGWIVSSIHGTTFIPDSGHQWVIEK